MARPAPPAKSTGKRRRKAGPAHDAVQADAERCACCGMNLKDSEKALFVEEEVGRVFCSEDCITAHFAPEIERMEKDYLRHRDARDLSPSDREALAHLRWVTLEEPDEIWREKTLAGDHRYTLISEFQPGSHSIWCVCICLFLRGEPSFLYLAFPTRNAALVNHYRRGERVQWARPKPKDRRAKAAAVAAAVEAHQATKDSGKESRAPEGKEGEASGVIDGLAEAWTEEETLRAQVTSRRSRDDIPPEQFELYEACLEETLEAPNEVWVIPMGAEGAAGAQGGEDDGAESSALYHFIRHYPDEKPGVWYVIVARDTEDENQLEILDAFPTRDPGLVERHRRGVQEVGAEEVPASSRLVH